MTSSAEATRRAIVCVPDLFFLTRIQAAAKRTGAAIEECAPAALAGRCAAAPPALVILDLHGPGDPLAAVRALKSSRATAGIPVVGFYSHVDSELRRRALAAGVDRVLPRSAFTAKLEELLAGAP